MILFLSIFTLIVLVSCCIRIHLEYSGKKYQKSRINHSKYYSETY